MRLNWFVPFPKKRRPSGLRRLLAILGTTWASSPLRRIVQTLCFLAFWWLFLYVCWPYTARPARSVPSWLPDEVDAEQGNLALSVEEPLTEPLAAGTRWFVLDPASGDQGNLGEFAVLACDGRRLELEPVRSLTQAQTDRLSTSFGPWTLSEIEPGSWPS
ncbi:MAG TPA: hypothetical protein PLF81_26795, partial [Candidatus Anammoximicrobium sp.]|nr:hypothetical protein [Candidatus Anammoximicrobium sp.]